jgi:hypothetical protein
MGKEVLSHIPINNLSQLPRLTGDGKIGGTDASPD